MSWSQRIRTTHRWVSIAFVVVVIVVAVMSSGGEEPPIWIYAFPGGGLVLLAVTGLYLFVLPFRTRRRGDPPRSD